jgi:hypothetical protein
VRVIPLIHEDEDAVARLAALGLTVDDLVSALVAGDAESRAWTEAAPPNMPGMARWGRTNESLRIGLAKKSKNWTYGNPRNLPLTINEPLSVAIVATSGDGGTGRRQWLPSTKYAKGIAVADAVEQNEQLALFSIVDAAVGEALGAVVASSNGLKTWIYLYMVTPEGIFSELSLPETISDDGYIDKWRERIIFPMYRFDDAVAAASGRPHDGGEITVTVERR